MKLTNFFLHIIDGLAISNEVRKEKWKKNVPNIIDGQIVSIVQIFKICFLLKTILVAKPLVLYRILILAVRPLVLFKVILGLVILAAVEYF